MESQLVVGQLSFSHSLNKLCRLVIMNSVSCILALGLLSSALGGHQQQGEKLSDVRGEFGDDEERHVLERTKLSKSSAGLNEQTCTALAGVESVLLNSTHTVSDFKAITI